LPLSTQISELVLEQVFRRISGLILFAGGAERLVVDAAVGLQALGHSLIIYTSHHNPNHCFEETRNGMLFSGRY
jgi:hypothetical protein